MSYYGELKENIRVIGNVQLENAEEIRAVNLVNEKAELLVGNGAAPTTLPPSPGIDGNMLVQDSTQPTGLKWSITNHLPASGVTAGSYTLSNVTVDINGLVTAASNGSIDINDITPTTTKGDLIVENDTPELDRLPIGNNDELLVVDTAETTGLKWVPFDLNDVTPTISKGDILVQTGTSLVRLPVGINNTVLTIDSNVTSTGLKYGSLNDITPTTTTGDLLIQNNSGELVAFPNSNTNNQVLAVDSTNLVTGVNWKTLSINDLVPTTTTGDLLVHDSSNDLVALPNSNTDNDVLQIDTSVTATFVKWDTYPGGAPIRYVTVKQAGLQGNVVNPARYVSEKNVFGSETTAAFASAWLFSFPIIVTGVRMQFYQSNAYTLNPGVISCKITDNSGVVLAGTDTPFDVTGETFISGVTTYMLDTPLTADTPFGLELSCSVVGGDLYMRVQYQIIYQ